MRTVGLALLLLLSLPLPGHTAKDLRTKEQRLYEIQLRKAQWEVEKRKLDMDTKLSTFEDIRDLFDQKIGKLDGLNQAQRDYLQAKLAYDQALIALDEQRLSFLRDATHISIREAKKYRTPDGRRLVEITLENASNLNQAISLNPQKTPAQVRALLEIQNIQVSIKDPNGLIIADPYEVAIPSLALGERRTLTFRLLNDYNEVMVSLHLLDNQENHYIVLRLESAQDIPTITSVQSSQEGDLNSRVRFDLILERLAEDEKTFRLAVLNLPKEIPFAFLDPSTNASLTQVKFSPEATRQQLALEVQIPEKLSRRYVDQTLEFYVFVTAQEGFEQIAEAIRRSGDQPVPLDQLNAIAGNKERFQLIPRGKGALETVIANRYQEIRTGEPVRVRVELLNPGTLEVGGVHLILTPPLDWTYTVSPDTIPHILPGEKEPVTITLVPPAGLGVSEYDVRVEAAGYVGSDKIEAQEKDLTIRVEAGAHLFRNALIIGGVIVLVVGVAVASIKISRR